MRRLLLGKGTLAAWLCFLVPLCGPQRGLSAAAELRRSAKDFPEYWHTLAHEEESEEAFEDLGSVEECPLRATSSSWTLQINGYGVLNLAQRVREESIATPRD